ncbi:ADP-ribosylation factor-like protein 4D [Oryzias melastigma]|uniref:ADP-ribosylation factor-like protein 11 n=1 Tax=Oryzias melastigma TaxID=30732 RepID=A0A834C0Q4_ORYME|nr:ADP-ribosylation factor-like protein 4D [Oryzias melastigma]KAF6720625.1 ADP-ribosylation factor-like protein 4D [Oryzias melastigma]
MGNQLTDMAPNTPFLPAFQSLHVVVLGLDSSGKTSLLYRLKLKEFVKTIPTKGFNTEKIKVPVGASRSINFQVWDVGGQEKLRPLWKSYTRRTDGIVFVVDSTELERMVEARVELHKITRTSENQGVPVLILANKQDLDSAMSAGEVEKLLSVQELSMFTQHHVQSCSAVDGQGLQAGLERLYEMILKRKKTVKHNKSRKR